jgi:hypothetical protein
VSDFVLSFRKVAPALVWYRRTNQGWDRYVMEKVDLDGDGDLDLLNKPYHWEAPRVDVWLNNGTDKKGGGAAKP